MSEEAQRGIQARSVLLADEIDRLAKDPSVRMIDPYRPSQLRPASYQLTLGHDIHLGGEHHRLDKLGSITLEPHQVAVVSTYEKLNIPRNMIARWSIRVTKIYEGLLWTGGPQVDPGWEGPLFCPIYNLAERKVVLKYREPMFTIDFAYTTERGDRYMKLKEEPEYSKIWFSAQREATLAEHDKYQIHSAPYEALRELENLKKFRDFAFGAIGLMFVVLGVMVAALAVVAVKPTVDPEGPFLSFWPMTALVFSIGSLVFSIGAIVYIYKVSKRL